MRDFFIEISVEKDGKIITLDTDDMDINIYQNINDKRVRTFEIRCCKRVPSETTCRNCVGGPLTIAKFVGRKNYGEIDVKTSPGKVVIYSKRGSR